MCTCRALVARCAAAAAAGPSCACGRAGGSKALVHFGQHRALRRPLQGVVAGGLHDVLGQRVDEVLVLVLVPATLLEGEQPVLGVDGAGREVAVLETGDHRGQPVAGDPLHRHQRRWADLELPFVLVDPVGEDPELPAAVVAHHVAGRGQRDQAGAGGQRAGQRVRPGAAEQDLPVDEPGLVPADAGQPGHRLTEIAEERLNLTVAVVLLGVAQEKEWHARLRSRVPRPVGTV